LGWGQHPAAEDRRAFLLERAEPADGLLGVAADKSLEVDGERDLEVSRGGDLALEGRVGDVRAQRVRAEHEDA
jgi:hypothetical protein